MTTNSNDFIVIGSGLAGLNSALHLATIGDVLIITKGKINDAATNLAQGGIAAVVDKDDSFNQHINDTLKAGCYHNNLQAVSFMVKQAPSVIKRLERLGVSFDRNENELALGREAAHQVARIVHATDFTGREIEKVLVKQVRETPKITVWERTMAIALITAKNRCFGVQIWRRGQLVNLYARYLILATGGAGQLYRWTTNPLGSTGDGLTLAHQAGAVLEDLEFIQFHPTALQWGKSPLFLLSEALRGEEAILVNEKGERFMKTIEGQELAPRDVVTRAIRKEQQKGNVYLDIRHQGKKALQKRFPNIYKETKKRGFDLATDLIPVTPAAHFLCGGIKTNLLGQTSVANLLAYGEVACTGVHGANRLASNSLLEAIAFSNQVKKAVSSTRIEKINLEKNEWKKQLSKGQKKAQIASPDRPGDIRKKIQQLMWENVGIVRTEKGLTKTVKKLEAIIQTCRHLPLTTRETAEVKFMSTAAHLITQSAKQRRHSLGAHFRDGP